MSMSPALTAMLQRIFDDASTHLMKQYKQCSVEKLAACIVMAMAIVVQLVD